MTPLTPTEIAVARLLAGGFSQPSIAELLSLPSLTVGRLAFSIYRKAGFPSDRRRKRRQVTAWWNDARRAGPAGACPRCGGNERLRCYRSGGDRVVYCGRCQAIWRVEDNGN